MERTFWQNGPSVSGWVTTSTATAIFSILVFGLSFLVRHLALDQTVYANGWDGYFYINQVRAFIEEGQMDVPDTSLVYPLMIMIQLITDDYILSYKLLTCVLAGGFTMSMFLLAVKWSGNISSALIVGSLCVFSPQLTWFAAQYPKNLLGIVFLIWLLYYIDSKHWTVLLALLVLNFFGHRATALLAFMSLLAYASLRRLTRFIPYIVIFFILTFAAAGFFLPGLLNILDAGRLKGILSGGVQFAPYSFIREFGTDLLSPWWIAEIIASTVIFFTAAIYTAIQSRRGGNVHLTLIVTVLTVLIFPFFEWSMEGASFRLFLMFILLCPLALMFLISSIKNATSVAIICITLIAASFFAYRSYDPVKHDPPYALYQRIGDSIASVLRSRECELIIAHKSLAEHIVYATSIDAMSWIPEYKIKKEKLWRVAEGVKEIQFKYYLAEEDLNYVWRLTSSHTLVREDVWNRFLEDIRTQGDEGFLEEITDWQNPHRVRPGFLLKNKRD